MSWSQYCAWLPILAEPSIGEHLGMQIGSFSWFYDKVKPNAAWDIKVESCWKVAMPNVPYLGVTGKFMFRGKLNTAESMGNQLYGYSGRATGFGVTTLYWGGGVAAQGSINNSAVNTPPYYGDSVEDHINITNGFDTFNSEYPNYPEVGYDGIPIEEGIIAAIADALLF